MILRPEVYETVLRYEQRGISGESVWGERKERKREGWITTHLRSSDDERRVGELGSNEVARRVLMGSESFELTAELSTRRP